VYPILPANASLQWLKNWIDAYLKTFALEMSPIEKVFDALNYLKQLAISTENFPLQALADHYLQNPAILDWQMFYFSDILNRLSAAGFQFVGTMPVATNYAQTSVPFELQQLATLDRVTLEKHKALWSDQPYRCELYIKTLQPPLLDVLQQLLNYLLEEKLQRWLELNSVYCH